MELKKARHGTVAVSENTPRGEAIKNKKILEKAHAKKFLQFSITLRGFLKLRGKET